VTQSGSPGSGGVRVMARVGSGPFAPTTVWQPMRDGRVAIVNPTPYRVDVVSGRNAVRRGTPVPYTPIKVTAAERAAYRERMKSNRPITMSVGGPGGGIRTAPSRGEAPAIADAEFPATMAPFSGAGVQVTPEGEVWVLRARSASDNVPTYDIFDTTGRLTGRATLNPHSTVVGFGLGSVYVSRKDPEDDLLYIEKYRRAG
jgi:hypothetical protein